MSVSPRSVILLAVAGIKAWLFGTHKCGMYFSKIIIIIINKRMEVQILFFIRKSSHEDVVQYIGTEIC